MDAVYIHIPFCRTICSYCDFCKVLYQDKWILTYLDALSNEIGERYNHEEIKTLYIGGGTPSSLSLDSLTKLLEICQKLNLSKLEEFSFECNLNDINTEMLEVLKKYQVNRLSIGIESFNKKKLKFMARNHSYKEAKEKMRLIRKMGFKNVNIDLIYGIPKESLWNLGNDLNKILKLNPEHVSTYSLIVEDNTKIGISKMMPIDEDLDYAMYDLVCKKLKKKYCHYEVSNFSKEGYEAKHNSNYWLNNEYYGFGLGAHGFIGNVRYENTKNIINYIKGNYRLKEEVLSKKDDMDNQVMLGFRLLKGINLQTFFDKYEINFQDAYDVKQLLKDKELIYDDGYIKINPKYIYVMNEILIKLI